MTDQPPVPAPPHQIDTTKLLRIAMMTQEMLGEARRAPLDPQARVALHGILEKTVIELKEVLPPELQEELDDVGLELSSEPTEAELRLAQAQLVGWLQGLFHGIQASMIAQQVPMPPRRGLPQSEDGSGQYL